MVAALHWFKVSGESFFLSAALDSSKLFEAHHLISTVLIPGHLMSGCSDLTGNWCPSLQKSSSGYIKLFLSQGGGPWECVVMREVVGHLPFFCSAGVVWTRTTRNRFVAQTSWRVDSGGFRYSLKMCGWIYLYISVFISNTLHQDLFRPQLKEHPLRSKSLVRYQWFMWISDLSEWMPPPHVLAVVRDCNRWDLICKILSAWS